MIRCETKSDETRDISDSKRETATEMHCDFYGNLRTLLLEYRAVQIGIYSSLKNKFGENEAKALMKTLSGDYESEDVDLRMSSAMTMLGIFEGMSAFRKSKAEKMEE